MMFSYILKNIRYLIHFRNITLIVGYIFGFIKVLLMACEDTKPRFYIIDDTYSFKFCISSFVNSSIV